MHVDYLPRSRRVPCMISLLNLLLMPVISNVCVHCAVTIMSEQAPTITDTTVRQPVDSEAVSSTADTTGGFIEGPPVCVHGGVALKPVGVAKCCNTHPCLAASVVRLLPKHVLKGLAQPQVSRSC